MTPWSIEVIPDHDGLYMRIHLTWVKDGLLVPGVFRNRNTGMSTDWARYSTPVDTQRRARDPAKNGVIGMMVGDVRRIPGQSVEHAPDSERDHRAHTEVYGEKDPEVRLKFRRICRWVIPIPPSSP